MTEQQQQQANPIAVVFAHGNRLLRAGIVSQNELPKQGEVIPLEKHSLLEVRKEGADAEDLRLHVVIKIATHDHTGGVTMDRLWDGVLASDNFDAHSLDNIITGGRPMNLPVMPVALIDVSPVTQAQANEITRELARREAYSQATEQ